MQFRDLGPLRIDVDQVAVTVPGKRLNSVLAILVANGGRVVPTPHVVQAVWGDAPPVRASASLDSLLWRLRKFVEPEERARRAHSVLRTEPGGYRLAVEPAKIDSAAMDAAARRLPRLVEDAPGQALELIEEMLSRWRGEPFEDVPDAAWMRPFRQRMNDLNGDFEQFRAQLLIDTGHPERAAATAGLALRRHPFREQLWEHLMVALYRGGRQAAALQAFRSAQQTLADELGVDPGPGLQRLHAQLLTHDRSLLGDRDHAPTVVRLLPGNLPARRTPLVGREFELATMTDLLTSERLVTVTGPVGVGKTRLAIAVAGAAGLFPDVVDYVDLSAVSDRSDVGRVIASTAGLAIDDERDTRRALTGYYATRRSLLVLDNCEHVVVSAAATVDSLLSTTAHLAILATSREPLDLDDEQVFPLTPFPTPVSGPGPAFAEEPAARLFLNRLGLPGGDFVLSDLDTEHVRVICDSVSGLPLGIELAAARTRAFTLAEVAASITADPAVLTRPGHKPVREANLHEAIQVSYRLCRPQEQLTHQRLSVLTGPFTLAAATAVTARGTVTAPEIPDRLAGLVHRSMLTAAAPHGSGPTMFRQLVPLRAHAATTLRSHRDERETVAARDGWVEQLVAAGPRRGRPGQREWYEALSADYPTVIATLEGFLSSPDGNRGALLASRLSGFWYDRNRGVDALHWLDSATRHPGLADFPAAAAAATYGSFLSIVRDREGAHRHIERALPVLVAAPPEYASEAAGLLVDVAAATWVGDDWEYSSELTTTAIRRCEAVGAAHELTIAHVIAAAGQMFRGDAETGLATIHRILHSGESGGNGLAMRFASAAAGVAALFGGDPDAGLHWSAEAVRLARHDGALNIGESLEQRGLHLVNAARPEDAVRCFAAAAAATTAVGLNWPRHDETPGSLDILRAQLPAAAFGAAWSTGERLMAMDLADDSSVDLMAWL